MDAGLVGGMIGAIFGFLGGVIGTYFSIKNTHGPLERAFMIKASVIAWLAVIIFLTMLLLIPKPYNYLAWIPYGIVLPIGIYKINKTQAELRDRESQIEKS